MSNHDLRENKFYSYIAAHYVHRLVSPEHPSMCIRRLRDSLWDNWDMRRGGDSAAAYAIKDMLHHWSEFHIYSDVPKELLHSKEWDIEDYLYCEVWPKKYEKYTHRNLDTLDTASNT